MVSANVMVQVQCMMRMTFSAIWEPGLYIVPTHARRLHVVP